MIRALKIRKRLGEAGAVTTVGVCLAFIFAFRSAGQAEGVNLRVAQTQDILRLVSRARLDGERLRDCAWEYRKTRNPRFAGRFRSDLYDLQEDMERLRVLTADDPLPQDILAEASAIPIGQFADFKEALEQAAAPAAAVPGASLDWREPKEPADRLQPLFDRLEAKERALLATRSAAVQANARQTQTVLAIAGLLTVVLILAGGHLMRRENQMRTEVERGLRHAQKLLSVKYEKQDGEPGETMEDLHAQILAQQEPM